MNNLARLTINACGRLAVLAYSVLCFHACATLQAQSTQRFVAQIDGTLDTQTGLVWGFSLSRVSNATYTWEGAQSLAIGTVEYNGIVYTNYTDWSNARLPVGATPSFNWRIPSPEELQAAAQAGLFVVHDIEPGPDFSNDNGTGILWSNRKKGNKYYVVDVNTPPYSIFLLGQSALDAIPVRGGANTGGGSGGGKGKNK